MTGFGWELPPIGFAVGLIIGLTGMGGGLIMTPLLMLGLGMPPTMAVGTDLAYAFVTKIAGTWQHWRQGTVQPRVARDMAYGSIPAALLAIGLLTWMTRHDTNLSEIWLQRLIGVVLLVAASMILYQLVFRRDSHASAHALHYHRRRVITIGVVGGFLVGLTSIGSGSLMLALLVLVVPLPAARLVGTDIAHATLLSGTAAIAHLFLGHVDLALAGGLILGSIPGVLLGSRLAVIAPRHALQLGLSTVLLGTAARLLG